MSAGDFLRDLSLAMISLGPLAIAPVVVQFLRRYWHLDAERAMRVLRYAQRAVLGAIAVSLAIAFWSLLGDIESLFGLLPLLELELNGGPAIAVAFGIGVLLLRLRMSRERRVLVSVIGVLLLAVVLALTQVPSRFGYWWCSAFGTWLLARRLFRIQIPLAFQRRQSTGWIYRIHERGGELTPLSTVASVHRRQISISREAPVYFGFTLVPIERSEGHYLIAGGSGSGKTIFFRLMMQSVLPRFGRGSSGRAIIFDAKREQISVLQGMALSVPITILNPFDARCRVWDVARDILTPSDALQLAQLLLPDEEKANEDPFWRKTGRGVIADVIRAHILAYQEESIPDWSLSDIVRSLQTEDDINTALAMHPSTADALRNLTEEKIRSGVLAQLDLVRREFEVLAALWDGPYADPGRRFSLNEWMRSSGILVLGMAASSDQVLKPLNRLIIDRVGQLILDNPEQPYAQSGGSVSRTWAFLDEFPRLGRMTKIENLMTNGRSKGFVAVLGFQEISDLRENYGPNFSETITGACSNRIQLEAPSATHAEWAEKFFGSEDVVVVARNESTSHTSGGQNSSTTRQTGWNSSDKTRPLFTRDEFLYLGKPGIRTPIYEMPPWVFAFRDTPVVRDLYRFYSTSTFTPIRGISRIQGQVFEAQLSFTDAVEALCPKVGSDFEPRPITDQFLARWSRDLKPDPLPAPDEQKALSLPEALKALWAIATSKSRQKKKNQTDNK